MHPGDVQLTDAVVVPSLAGRAGSSTRISPRVCPRPNMRESRWSIARATTPLGHWCTSCTPRAQPTRGNLQVRCHRCRGHRAIGCERPRRVGGASTCWCVTPPTTRRCRSRTSRRSRQRSGRRLFTRMPPRHFCSRGGGPDHARTNCWADNQYRLRLGYNPLVAASPTRCLEPLAHLTRCLALALAPEVL